MKNLKKVLSLVLALAMALSLMTVAFAADASDYKDYDKVTHKEAVDVMTAIGVFNDTGDGTNFTPDGTLTREQAAQMAFNAMKTDIVEYDAQTSIDIDGTQINVGNTRAQAITTTRSWGANIYAEGTTGDSRDPHTVQFLSSTAAICS